MTQRDLTNGIGDRLRAIQGGNAHEREQETTRVSPPGPGDPAATEGASATAESQDVPPMDIGPSTPPSDDAPDGRPLGDARMAMLRTRREAYRELRQRAAAVFSAAPAASFVGFRALMRAVMPASPAERDDLSTRLGVHPDAIEWLLDDTLEWYDIDREVIVDLAWTLGLTRQTFLDLLVSDLNREVEEGGGQPRRAAGWVEVTAPILSLWDEGAAAGGERSERE